MRVDHIPPGTWLEVDPDKFNQIITKPIKKDNMNPINDRASCIAIVLSGTNEPVQTKTLEALERDRLRIAKLIAGEDKQLRQLIDSYTMASKGYNMTGYESKRAAARDKLLDDDDTQVYQRPWVGLTDDAEIFAISNTMPYADRFEFARAVEAELKEKNNG